MERERKKRERRKRERKKKKRRDKGKNREIGMEMVDIYICR